MGGENREIRVMVSTNDVDHWHPAWKRAAHAERAEDYHGWLMRDLREAVRRVVEEFAAAHPDEIEFTDVTG